MDSTNRRSGILLDEDYNVYGDQKETDDELSKAALAGIVVITIFSLFFIVQCTYSTSTTYLTFISASFHLTLPLHLLHLSVSTTFYFLENLFYLNYPLSSIFRRYLCFKYPYFEHFFIATT